MSRVAFVGAALAAAMASVLAGCSGSSSSLSEWLSPKPSPPPLQTLNFRSQPPGADVRTTKGQNCQTPCSLQVPPESQSVTFAKGGFAPQTVQVSVADRTDHSWFAKDSPPTLNPNPVEVALQALPKPAAKLRHRKTVSGIIHRPSREAPAQQSATAAPPAQQQ
jgi:PEGA domain